MSTSTLCDLTPGYRILNVNILFFNADCPQNQQENNSTEESSDDLAKKAKGCFIE